MKLSLKYFALGTWLGRAYAPPVRDESLKKFAYFLLLFMGLWILGRSVVAA